MSEPGKLVVGFVGVIIGLVAGFVAVILIMQRTGGALFDNPGLGLLVVAVLVGGGAALIGYLALTIVERAERNRKRTGRKEKQAQKKSGTR
jgi:hypothetical protein